MKLIAIMLFAFCVASLNVGCSEEANGKTGNLVPVLTNSTPPGDSGLDSSEMTLVVEGVPIPILKKSKKLREVSEEMMGEDGKAVAVTITDYVSEEPLFFEHRPFTPMQKLNSIGGTMKLEMLSEIKVNHKIFSYSVFERKTAPNSKSHKSIGHMYVFRCADTDGDGKFETVYHGDSILKVPLWALK